MMDSRSRIINTVLFNKIDRQPFNPYFGPWTETVMRWENEGLPKNSGWKTGLNFDPGIHILDVNLGFCPSFKKETIDEKEDTWLVRTELGILQEVWKGGSTIPKVIENPVKDRESWKKIMIERLNPDSPERFPSGWDNTARTCINNDYIIQLGKFPYGLFGTLRDLLGVENLLIAFYDDPDLIHEIMDYLTDFWISIYEKVCAKIKIDAIHIWEDMSGKNGSLISPQMVNDFMLPNYKKISSFAHKHNIPIISLDTDGDCSQLIPLFLEGGINMLLPFEVAAGNDVIKIRKQYPKLCIVGGIDKREIAKGPESIDRELKRIIPMFGGPGYWPALDHLIHPEISYNDYKYFVLSLWQRINQKNNSV